MEQQTKTTRELAIENGKIWQVYPTNEPDNILFEGSRSKCHLYISTHCPQSYRKNEIRIAKLIYEPPIKEESSNREEWDIFGEQSMSNAFAGNRYARRQQNALLEPNDKTAFISGAKWKEEIQLNPKIEKIERETQALRESNTRLKERIEVLENALEAFITFDLSDTEYTDIEDTETLKRIINEAKEALNNK